MEAKPRVRLVCKNGWWYVKRVIAGDNYYKLLLSVRMGDWTSYIPWDNEKYFRQSEHGI